MQPAIYTKEKTFSRLLKPSPSVSIIMPFEPKMVAKSGLQYQLKMAVKNAEEKLLNQYSAFTQGLIIEKIKALIASLDYTSYRKSIVLFSSSVIEKIYYLDIEMQQKVIVGQFFEIRGIALNKQLQQEYLLLILDNEKEKLFVGNGEQLQLLVINSGNNFAAKPLNFPDIKKEKGEGIQEFVSQVDDGLSIILNAYPLPLFLLCTQKARDRFMQLSKNKDHVLEYLPGNYEDVTEAKLQALMQPYLKDWQKIKEKGLLLQLERAMSKGKYAAGIKDVYKAASQKRGRLLIVEKNYFSPAFIGEKDELNPVEESMQNNLIYTNDAVDDIIEKVLENGGDVDFVSDGLLKDYMHIALIQSS